LTIKWPVLHYGSVPHFDAAKWDFKISGLVETPLRLTWEEFHALPQVESTSDFHCVTRWSRLDNRWKGVRFTDVVERAKAKPEAIRASARRGGIYIEYPTEGFVAAGCPVRFRT